MNNYFANRVKSKKMIRDTFKKVKISKFNFFYINLLTLIFEASFWVSENHAVKEITNQFFNLLQSIISKFRNKMALGL